MSYDFSFDKKSIFFILGGSVAIGALLFFAGFILGWDRGTEEAKLEFQKQSPAAPVVAKAKTAPASVAPVEIKTATDGQAAPPKETPSSQQREQKGPAAPEQKAEAKPAPVESGSPARAGSDFARDGVKEPEKKAESEKKPETQASASSATMGEKSSAQNKPSPAAQTDADEASGFSLQIGAFQNEDNALRCQSSLKSRGYTVFVFNTLDAAGRTWHTVRMGHYPNIDKASAAAAVFTTKERLPVFIRPVDEL